MKTMDKRTFTRNRRQRQNDLYYNQVTRT